jgi:putative transposase
VAKIVVAQRTSMGDAYRWIRFSEQNYYRWLKEYAGLKTDKAQWIKELENENARLRRPIFYLTQYYPIPREVARRAKHKLLSRARRRPAAKPWKDFTSE